MELQSLRLHRRTGGLGTAQRGRVGKPGPQSHTATPEITDVLPAPLGVSPLPRHLLRPRCAPRCFKPCRDARGSPGTCHVPREGKGWLCCAGTALCGAALLCSPSSTLVALSPEGVLGHTSGALPFPSLTEARERLPKSPKEDGDNTIK